MLTDKEIEEIAEKFIGDCGDHHLSGEEMLIHISKDFARAIEKAVMDKFNKEVGKELDKLRGVLT